MEILYLRKERIKQKKGEQSPWEIWNIIWRTREGGIANI
jgi:hypothetical protein